MECTAATTSEVLGFEIVLALRLLTRSGLLSCSTLCLSVPVFSRPPPQTSIAQTMMDSCTVCTSFGHDLFSIPARKGCWRRCATPVQVDRWLGAAEDTFRHPHRLNSEDDKILKLCYGL